jgi:phage/plasmid-associated DNA primase
MNSNFFNYNISNNTKVLVETYDIDELKYIIDNFDDFSDIVGSFKDCQNNYIDIVEKNKKLTILKNMYKSQVISYKPSANSPDGRMFGKNSSQGINKKVRHTLWKNKCRDYDIVNCHNELLSKYCDANDIQCDYLYYYNSHRDEILQILMDEYKIDRGKAKQIPLEIINGGGDKYLMRVNPPDFLVNFRNEIKEIQHRIAELDPERFQKAMKKNKLNPYGTCLNTLMCKMENIILHCMIDYCELNNIKVYVLCFDGIMSDEINIQDLLSHIKHHIGIDIKIVEKEMDESFMDFIVSHKEKKQKEKEVQEIAEKNEKIRKKAEKDLEKIIQKRIKNAEKKDDLQSIFSESDFENVQKKDIVEKFMSVSSDLFAAEIFAKFIDKEMFLTKEFGWVVFNNRTKIWGYDKKSNELVYCVCKFFSSVFTDYIKEYLKEDNQNDDYLADLMKKLEYVSSTKFAKNVLSQLENLLSIEDEFMNNFESNGNLLCFSDGKCIDLDNNNNIRNIVKEDYVMTTTGYPIPERNDEYIKDARQIIYSISEDDEISKSMISMMSLSLYGSNKEQLMFMHEGPGANGKGAIANASKNVLGKYYLTFSVNNLTTDISQNIDKPNSELANSRFKRLLVSVEPETGNETIKLQVSTVKTLTGGDGIRTRFLNKNSFEFTPKFQLHLQCNNNPNITRKDDGFVRRLIKIEYPLIFVDYDEITGMWTYNNINYTNPDKNWRKKDTKLINYVAIDKNFRAGLLYLLLDSYQELKGKFYRCDKIRQDTDDYMKEMNPIKEFFEEYYELYELDDKATDIVNYRMSATEIFDNYKSKSYKNSIKDLRLFSKHIRELCPKHKNTSGNKLRFACRIKSMQNQYNSNTNAGDLM